MPGVAKTRKKYWINVNKEATFNTEPAIGGQTAISGEIQDTPSFSAKFESVKTKKHSEYGANATIKRGRFAGTLNYTATLQDGRPFYRVLGRTVDQPKTFTVENSAVSDFSVGERVTVAGDVVGVVDAVTGTGDSQVVTFELFRLDDTITSGDGAGGAGTGVGGTLQKIEYDGTNYIATLEGVTTAYIVGDTIIGATNSAEAEASAVSTLTNGIQTITLDIIIVSSSLTGATSGATADVLLITVHNHHIGAYRDQKSYALNYAYEDLGNQHVLTGSVQKSVGLESAINEAPKIADDWLFAKAVRDTTIDPEILNTHDIYIYTDVSSLSIDGNTQDGTAVDWTDIFKTASINITRSNLKPTDSHTDEYPKGFRGAEVETTLKFEIHRQDQTLVDLLDDLDGFAIILVFVRGTAGADDMTFTFNNCFGFNQSEEGEETILTKMDVEMEGTPLISINDNVSDYTT